MPKPRFQIEIEAGAQALIDQMKALIELQLPNPNRILDRLVNWPQEPTAAGIGAVLHVRFKATSDLDTLWAKIQALSIPANVHGAASRHECSHDDAAVYSCKDDPRSAYSERVF